MTVNRQQALLGRRTRHDGGSTYINALAFNTLLSSQETRAHHGRNKQPAAGATLKLYSGVSFVSTKFPGAYREVTDTRVLRPPAANPHEPREQRVTRGNRAARWLPE